MNAEQDGPPDVEPHCIALEHQPCGVRPKPIEDLLVIVAYVRGEIERSPYFVSQARILMDCILHII